MTSFHLNTDDVTPFSIKFGFWDCPSLHSNDPNVPDCSGDSQLKGNGPKKNRNGCPEKIVKNAHLYVNTYFNREDGNLADHILVSLGSHSFTARHEVKNWKQ